MKHVLRVVSQGAPRANEIKRCYLPGALLESDCSECGTVSSKDMGEHYLMYPENGSECEFWFYCVKCEHEWYAYATVSFSSCITPAEPAKEKESQS